MQEPQPPKKTPTLAERIEQEARDRADQKAENFDLMACDPFRDVEFDGGERIRVAGIRGREIVTTLAQLNFDIRRFLRSELAPRIAEQLRQRVLSDVSPEIDVTRLEPPTSNP